MQDNKYTRELAIKECRILWKYMVDNKVYGKWIAIDDLYKSGELSMNDYDNNCPLCEYVWQKSYDCMDCPWRQNTESICENKNSPYKLWEAIPDNAEAKHELTKAVYDLILTFK